MKKQTAVGPTTFAVAGPTGITGVSGYTGRDRPRPAVTLDGKPVYLYRFVHGTYEDKRWFAAAHAEKLETPQIRVRLLEAAEEVPEELSFDEEPDLFERALKRAGFVILEDDVFPLGLWLRDNLPPTTERFWLIAGLKTALPENKG
jgi:hypothetical protein